MKFVLVLPNIRSAHNVGAMFRTADGAGVDKIFLTGYTPCPPHPKVDKVSLGAEKSVPFEYRKTTVPLLKKLKKDGFTIVALEQTPKSDNIYSWDPKFPLALVVGNEIDGIVPSVLKNCDVAIHLPMRGKKNSLNVSIAAGVAIYHLAEKILNSPDLK